MLQLNVLKYGNLKTYQQMLRFIRITLAMDVPWRASQSSTRGKSTASQYFDQKKKKLVYFFLFEIQTVALILTRVHFLIFLSRLRLLGSKAPRPSSIFMISHTFVLNKRGERGMKMFILIKGGGCAQLSQDTKYTKIILRKIIVHIFLFFELNF